MEIKNWSLEAVQCIRAGECDVTTLTGRFDQMDIALVQMVLDIVAKAGK
ncbi:MAG TPA: hypothetical protein VEI53_00575 [Ktedonobacteraceae bacterium]|nr:hypothetical protein [Ktedonobacteraceae bacterium]